MWFFFKSFEILKSMRSKNIDDAILQKKNKLRLTIKVQLPMEDNQGKC